MDSAVLITYDQDDMIDEAVALCESADYKVKHVIKQNFLQKPKYGLSGGKIEDLKEIISTVKPDVVVFDEILKPSQNYNLASELKMEILDREALILQIFEKDLPVLNPSFKLNWRRHAMICLELKKK